MDHPRIVTSLLSFKLTQAVLDASCYPKTETPSVSDATPARHGIYAHLAPSLLPSSAGVGPAGGPASGNPERHEAAGASRLIGFVRGMLATRRERTATELVESKLQHKVLHLETPVVPRDAKTISQQGLSPATRLREALSRKQCKKKVNECESWCVMARGYLLLYRRGNKLSGKILISRGEMFTFRWDARSKSLPSPDTSSDMEASLAMMSVVGGHSTQENQNL